MYGGIRMYAKGVCVKLSLYDRVLLFASVAQAVKVVNLLCRFVCTSGNCKVPAAFAGLLPCGIIPKISDCGLYN